MELIPRIESSGVISAGTPLQPASAAPAAAEPTGAEPARYDGSPPLTAWTWSWAQSGGSLVDLAAALALAQQLRGSTGLAAGAHPAVDGHRALALLSA